MKEIFNKKITDTLKQSPTGLSFTELHLKTTMTTPTLSKYLSNLQANHIIVKQEGKYIYAPKKVIIYDPPFKYFNVSLELEPIIINKDNFLRLKTTTHLKNISSQPKQHFASYAEVDKETKWHDLKHKIYQIKNKKQTELKIENQDFLYGNLEKPITRLHYKVRFAEDLYQDEEITIIQEWLWPDPLQYYEYNPTISRPDTIDVIIKYAIKQPYKIKAHLVDLMTYDKQPISIKPVEKEDKGMKYTHWHISYLEQQTIKFLFEYKLVPP